MLLLRLVLAATLIVSPCPLGRGASILLGGFLVAGLWTPLAALAGAVLGVWTGLSVRDTLPFVLAGVAVSLTALGPGAWSLDAMLYGRRKISIQSRDHLD